MLDDRARGVMEDFMDHLPVTTFAFAYGSAVFSQRSSSGTKQDVASPMLDVILFVNDALEWHSEVRQHSSRSGHPQDPHRSYSKPENPTPDTCAEHRTQSEPLRTNCISGRKHCAEHRFTAGHRVAF